jgi:rhamnulokinase
LVRSGDNYSYDDLTELAAEVGDNGPIIDALDPRFYAPTDMPSEIRAACKATGQPAPDTVGGLIRCCLDSLALAYRRAVADIESVTRYKIEVLHIVGGGCKNKLLNQLAADACGIPVVAGPSEATAVGNVLTQMIGKGALLNWQEANEFCVRSFAPETYMPTRLAHEHWAERQKLLEKK